MASLATRVVDDDEGKNTRVVEFVLKRDTSQDEFNTKTRLVGGDHTRVVDGDATRIIGGETRAVTGENEIHVDIPENYHELKRSPNVPRPSIL